MASRVGVGRSHDKSLIMIATGDNATSEVRFVSANDPSQPLTLISRRKPNREYHVDAAHGKLWIHTNDDHVNFRLAEADVSNPEEWRTVIAGSDRVYLTGVTSYRDHLAISSRVEGLDQLVLAHLRRARRRAFRSRRRATAPSSWAIRSSRRRAIASAIRRWSRR